MSKHEVDIETSWENYCKRLLNSKSIPIIVGVMVGEIRKNLNAYLRRYLAPPEAAPGEEGGVELIWHRDEEELIIEVLPSGRYEWFYRNKATNFYAGEEGCKEFPTPALKQYIQEWSMEPCKCCDGDPNLVCASCGEHACWAGLFYCENYKTADIVRRDEPRKTVKF